MGYGDNFGVDENGVLTANSANITGTITATAGKIGGWTINETSISCENGLSLDSTTGSITVGNAVLKSTGFHNASGAAYPTVENVKIWNGWATGWGKLHFTNGLLTAYENTGFDAGQGDQAVFKYTVSTDSDFKDGASGATWGVIYNPISGDVGSDGTFTFTCTLKPPEALYTKNATQGSVTK
jgi:hypothetical protein